MGSYRVVLKPSVEKDFRKLDRTIVRRILAAPALSLRDGLRSSASSVVESLIIILPQGTQRYAEGRFCAV